MCWLLLLMLCCTGQVKNVSKWQPTLTLWRYHNSSRYQRQHGGDFWHVWQQYCAVRHRISRRWKLRSQRSGNCFNSPCKHVQVSRINTNRNEEGKARAPEKIYLSLCLLSPGHDADREHAQSACHTEQEGDSGALLRALQPPE